MLRRLIRSSVVSQALNGRFHRLAIASDFTRPGDVDAIHFPRFPLHCNVPLLAGKRSTMADTAADWNNLPKEHNLSKFVAELPDILKKTEYNEMYGVELKVPEEGQQPAHTTLVILQKFLRANMGDLPKAKEQLINALTWRKSYKPHEALTESFSYAKFGGLGYVTTIKGAKETKNEEDVATFNIYGVAAKDPKKTFGDTDAFIRWRVAVMELTLQQIHLDKADKPIPDYGNGPDPYQAIQVHDYLSVSFFRQPPEIKASSRKIIEVFSTYYPETVSYKYFVNVPTIMQWMMGVMKMLLSKDTIQKMTWMTYGNQLHEYLGDGVPKEYGGKGPELVDTALTVKYDSAPAAESKPGEEDKAAPEATTGDKIAETPDVSKATENNKAEATEGETAKSAIESDGPNPAG